MRSSPNVGLGVPRTVGTPTSRAEGPSAQKPLPTGQLGPRTAQWVHPHPQADAAARMQKFMNRTDIRSPDATWRGLERAVHDAHPGLRERLDHLGPEDMRRVHAQYQRELRDTARQLAADPAFAKLGEAGLRDIAKDVLANVLLRHAKDPPLASGQTRPLATARAATRPPGPEGRQSGADGVAKDGSGGVGGLRQARRGGVAPDKATVASKRTAQAWKAAELRSRPIEYQARVQARGLGHAVIATVAKKAANQPGPLTKTPFDERERAALLRGIEARLLLEPEFGKQPIARDRQREIVREALRDVLQQRRDQLGKQPA